MLTFNSSARRRPRLFRRGLSRRAPALVVGIVTLAVALPGCGGGSDATGGTTAQDSSVPSKIAIATDQVVTALNPNAYPDYEFDQITLLWGGYLTNYGSGSPELADTVSPANGFRVWTVKLRPGLKFSDGTPLQSKDVVASIERVVHIEGVVGDTSIGPFISNLRSLKANGDAGVTFTFHRPEPDFSKQVSQPDWVIVPASGLAKGESFWKHPVSAGRYAIASADLVNGSFELTANPNYPFNPPKVTKLVITSVPDPATRLADLKSGQVDYAENMPGNLLPQITGNLRVDAAPWYGGSITLQPNLAKGAILSDVRIRQAINLAVDRKQIAQTALGGEIAGKPLYGIPWNQTNEPPNVQPFPPEPTKAKELLKGTACENGCTIKMPYYTNAVWQLPLTAQVVAQQLRSIGIKLELDGIPLSQSDPYVKGWGAYINWTGEWNNSQRSLSNYYVTGEWQSSEGYSDPALVALGEKMAVASKSEIPSLIERANKLYAEYLPDISLTALTYLGATSVPTNVLSTHGVAYFDLG